MTEYLEENIKNPIQLTQSYNQLQNIKYCLHKKKLTTQKQITRERR